MIISVVQYTQPNSKIYPEDNPKTGHYASAPAYKTDYIDKYL